MFFDADDGIHGKELWRSNGTEAGTVLVKNIHPGARFVLYSYPQDLTAVGTTLFFSADDSNHGTELWRSDGTRSRPSQDISAGAHDGDPQDLTDVGGELYFTADDGIHGRELWRSDGTEAGTVQVKDIRPRGRDSDPSDLTDVGGELYFTADDGIHGRELWRSDGTNAGTVLVKDTDPTRSSYSYSSPQGLTDVDGRLFFAVSDGTHGVELWRSDGTETGTVQVKNINPGAGDSYPRELTDVGGTLFFTAFDDHSVELWRSDGTTTGTVHVQDVNPGVSNPYPGSSPTLTAPSSSLARTVPMGGNCGGRTGPMRARS